jgi:phage-related minor tail protein
MPVEMLTYAALAERLRISPEAQARHRLPRSRSNDGRALVPLFGRRVDAFAMRACIDSLQRELAKVEAMAAAHRADFKRERDRAEHLLLKAAADAMADAMAARELTARLEGELLELRSRPWWRRLAGY